MYVNINITNSSFESLKALQKKVALFRTRLRNRRQLMEEVKRKQKDAWNRNFLAGGGRYGGWAPLAENPHKPSERRKGTARQVRILKRTRTLQHSFHNQNRAGVVSNDSVLWSFHNRPMGKSGEGGRPLQHNQGYKNVPARVFWDLNARDHQLHREITRRWLRAVMKEVFG